MKSSSTPEAVNINNATRKDRKSTTTKTIALKIAAADRDAIVRDPDRASNVAIRLLRKGIPLHSVAAILEGIEAELSEPGRGDYRLTIVQMPDYSFPGFEFRDCYHVELRKAAGSRQLVAEFSTNSSLDLRSGRAGGASDSKLAGALG